MRTRRRGWERGRERRGGSVEGVVMSESEMRSEDSYVLLHFAKKYTKKKKEKKKEKRTGVELYIET